MARTTEGTFDDGLGSNRTRPVARERAAGKVMQQRLKPDEDRRVDDAPWLRVSKQAWFHRYPRGWPFMLFVITCCGTAASVIAIERADRQARAAELDRNATEIAAGLERRATENVALLRATAALFASRPEVTTREFEEFAASAYERGDNRGAIGTGWAPLLRAAQIPALEARRRAEHEPQFVVWPKPASPNALVAPVVDVVPLTATTRLSLGYDMLSDPERRATIMEAIRLGQPVATPRLTSIHTAKAPGHVGFVIYMPVQPMTEGRRGGIIGLVYSPFRAEDFLDSAAELYRSREVEIAVYDGPVAPSNLLAIRAVPGEVGTSIDRQISIAGRRWTLRVSTKNTSLLIPLSRATLIFGVLLGLLIMFTARVITRRAVDDRNLLEWQTRQAAIRTQLTRELNHRVKNTLANVLSIVALTRRRQLEHRRVRREPDRAAARAFRDPRHPFAKRLDRGGDRRHRPQRTRALHRAG